MKNVHDVSENALLLRERLYVSKLRLKGRVVSIHGLLIEAVVSDVAIGDLCKIHSEQKNIVAEVVSLSTHTVSLLPLEDPSGIKIDADVFKWNEGGCVGVGEHLLGHIVDGLGVPRTQMVCPKEVSFRSVYQRQEQEKRSHRIESMFLGVRSLDAFVPCALGQRLGIFAGAGVGKTTLMAMIAKQAQADVIVLGLIGERGREVDFFAQKVFTKETRSKTVMVVSTSDESPAMRVRAAFSATAIAEYFRSKGKKVLLFIDSLTRLAMAQREIGLSTGEPPTAKGYPPSVFSMMPKLLERAYASASGGCVTGIYTVLVEGDDLSDPVADSARSLLDGHIVLSRSLAIKNHYPAVDVLQSLSRLENELIKGKHKEAVNKIRVSMSLYEEMKDMISIGAYKKGTDPKIDKAIQMAPVIDEFLKQSYDETISADKIQQELITLSEKC